LNEEVFFKSADYSEALKENYTLSVIIGQQLIQYGVYNHLNELKYFAQQNVGLITNRGDNPYDFFKFFSENLYFNHAVAGIVGEFAVIPEEYFDDSKLSAYLANQLGEDYEVEYSYDILQHPKIRIVYKKDTKLIAALNEHFNEIETFNSITPLIKIATEKNKQPAVVVNSFFEDSFDYICLRDGILQMANRYNAKSAENYLYFLLNAVQHNKLNFSNINLFLAEYPSYKHYNLSSLARCV